MATYWGDLISWHDWHETIHWLVQSYFNAVLWLVGNKYPHATFWLVWDTYPIAAICLEWAIYHLIRQHRVLFLQKKNSIKTVNAIRGFFMSYKQIPMGTAENLWPKEVIEVAKFSCDTSIQPVFKITLFSLISIWILVH